MVINNKASKIYKLFVLPFIFFPLEFVMVLFVGTVLASSIILSQAITELSIMLPACLPFSQLLVEGF